MVISRLCRVLALCPLMLTPWVVMSSQPGRVLDDLEIDFPRPRPPSLDRAHRFTDYVRHIKDVLSMDSAYTVPTVEASVGL